MPLSLGQDPFLRAMSKSNCTLLAELPSAQVFAESSFSPVRYHLIFLFDFPDASPACSATVGGGGDRAPVFGLVESHTIHIHSYAFDKKQLFYANCHIRDFFCFFFFFSLVMSS